jgi:hypothetical protein
MRFFSMLISKTSSYNTVIRHNNCKVGFFNFLRETKSVLFMLVCKVKFYNHDLGWGEGGWGGGYNF